MHLAANWPVATLYRVEISGWDLAQLFFVEKAELEWSEEGDKHLILTRDLRSDAIVFVRLLQPVSADRSCPVPYTTEKVEQVDEQRWKFRLKQVHPHVRA